jgi:hypothetical protein
MRRLVFISLLVLAIGCGVLQSQRAATRHNEIVTTQRNELTVYITDTGERYHVSSCRYLRYSKHPVPLAEAKRRGYTPCKVCQPPR